MNATEKMHVQGRGGFYEQTGAIRDVIQNHLFQVLTNLALEPAWRIVDPVLKADTPVHQYERNTWGPTDVDKLVSPAGGWQHPVATDKSETERCS